MLRIRPELPRDHERIRIIHSAAFGRPDEADLVDRLRARADPYVALVAVLGGEIVGHIAFTPVSFEPPIRDVDARGLAPMAVHPARQRAGVGTALVREGLAACRASGVDAVVVVGHANYYPRFGFERASDRGITCEFDVPLDAFMILELTPGAIERAQGTVYYHPAFRN